MAPAERREEAGANQRVALNIVIRDQNQYATPMTKMLLIARNKISRGSLRTRTSLSISSVPWASVAARRTKQQSRGPNWKSTAALPGPTDSGKRRRSATSLQVGRNRQQPRVLPHLLNAVFDFDQRTAMADSGRRLGDGLT